MTPPHLLIDAGNTRIKWALMADVNSVDILERGIALTHDDAPLNDLACMARQHSRLAITASVVAGEGVKEKLSAALHPHQIDFISATKNGCGVENSYTNPAQLGADRFAALIAARQISSTPTLVVMAGTALTIDALCVNGVFLGGVILPGLSLMRASLNQQTAQLPLVESAINTQANFARDTTTAIASGTLDACIGAIIQNARRLETHSQTTINIVASGGAVNELAAILTSQYGFTLKIVDDLVLDGLQLIAQLAQST